MLSSTKKRLLFSWASLLSLLTVAYARAHAVSNTPSLTTERRIPSTKFSPRQQLSSVHQQRCKDLLKIEEETDEDLLPLLLSHRGGAAAAAATPVTTAAAATTTSAAWVDGLKNSLASALAAAFSKTILAPFDTVKTLQQYYQSTPSMPSLTLLEAAKVIMKRPGGFINFYVRRNKT